MGTAKIVSLAICIGFGLAFVFSNVGSWDLEDMDAYWNAALRLKDGAPLYPSLVDPGAADVFRYAPWFAWLWFPLTAFPKALVQVGWSVILLGSIPFAVAPILRRPSAAVVCLVALMGGLLFRTASSGNVHALLVAILVQGVTRRSGPLWIGVAASLKLSPLVYGIVYAGRAQWRRAFATLAVAAILVAPALLYDLTNYPADPGNNFSILSIAGPVPFAILSAVAVVVAFYLGRTPKAWGAASMAVLCLTPRLELYGLTYLLVGLAGERWPTAGAQAPAPA